MSFFWCNVCHAAMRGASDPEHEHIRCAYTGCQAGGIILAGAPRVESKRWVQKPGPDRWTLIPYHPGCWASQQRLLA